MKIICIMPCYNAEGTIAKSIESVINQDYTNWELIIVDDASTDKSVNIIKKYLKNPKITLLQNQTNRGCYYSRNRGLHHVKDKDWDWFTVHDSDDISHPDRFKTHIDYSLEGDMDYIYGCGRGNRYNWKTKRLVFKQQNNLIGIAFISRKLFNKLGYFDSDTRFGGDAEYRNRYKVVVTSILRKFSSPDTPLSEKNVGILCDTHKIMMCRLPMEYTYLYEMGYTVGNNLTQRHLQQERELYIKTYTSNHSTFTSTKDLYLSFEPHPEDSRL